MNVTFYNKRSRKIFTVSNFPDFSGWTEEHSNFVNLVCNSLSCTYMPTHDESSIPFDLIKQIFVKEQ